MTTPAEALAKAEKLYALAKDRGAAPEERRTASLLLVELIETYDIRLGAPETAPERPDDEQGAPVVPDGLAARIRRFIWAFARAPAVRAPAPHPMRCSACRGGIIMHEACYYKGPLAWHLGCYRHEPSAEPDEREVCLDCRVFHGGCMACDSTAYELAERGHRVRHCGGMR